MQISVFTREHISSAYPTLHISFFNPCHQTLYLISSALLPLPTILILTLLHPQRFPTILICPDIFPSIFPTNSPNHIQGPHFHLNFSMSNSPDHASLSTYLSTTTACIPNDLIFAMKRLPLATSLHPPFLPPFL